MINLREDAMLYVNEGVMILEHHEIGLIMLLKAASNEDTMARALRTCRMETQGNVVDWEGFTFIRLRRTNGETCINGKRSNSSLYNGDESHKKGFDPNSDI